MALFGGKRAVFAPDDEVRPALSELPESHPTGAELIELVARARGASAMGGVLHDVLEIDRVQGVRIAAMSSGMRQRLALHLAFVGDPAVVLLDEPFNWLDPVAAYDAKERLSDYARSRPLITALHEVTTFALRCTAGLLVRDGLVTRNFDGRDLNRGASDVAGFERRLYEALRERS